MSYLRPILAPIDLFLPIPGYPHYEIRIDGGAIRNGKSGRYLTIKPHRAGSRCYLSCGIGRVHRLLKSALLGRELATTEYVCHRNGNTFDNAPANLRVASPGQNALDRIATNTNGRVLRNQHVREIRRLAGRETIEALALRYGVSRGHIRRIIAGKTWANLP